MAKEKKTKFVILGFLLNDSLSGYEIGEKIKQSTKNFWQESDASIYPTLKLLTKVGFVSAKSVYVGKRRKDIFTITDAGRKAYLEWFKRPPDQDLPREEFLLKLFFTDETTEDQMRQHCNEKLKELKKLHEKYKEIENFLIEQFPQKIYWLKTLRVGLAHLDLDITLVKEHYGEIYATNNH